MIVPICAFTYVKYQKKKKKLAGYSINYRNISNPMKKWQNKL